MLGNWIKATSATGGTGNLVLTAVTGFPGPADVFAIGQPFSYVILDANSRPLEAGTGYMSNSTTFVRSVVRCTYAGGVYNASSPTAQNLTGTVTVTCALHASSADLPLTTVDGVSGGIHRHVTSAHRGMPAASVQLSSLRCYYAPFLLEVGAVITGLALFCTAPVASSNTRCGLYACSHQGTPGIQLMSTGNVDTSSGGMKVAALESRVFVPPGRYFTAMAVDGPVGVTAYSGANGAVFGGHPFGFASGSTTTVEQRYEALASLSLPSVAAVSLTAVNAGVSHTPAVYLQMG